MYPTFTELNNRFLNTKIIIQNISNLTISPEYADYTQTQKNYLKSILIHSEEHGTLLDEKTKNTIFSIKEEIAHLSKEYNDNVQQATQSVGIVVENEDDWGDLPAQWREVSSEHYSKKYEKESSPEKGLETRSIWPV